MKKKIKKMRTKKTALYEEMEKKEYFLERFVKY